MYSPFVPGSDSSGHFVVDMRAMIGGRKALELTWVTGSLLVGKDQGEH